jgi:hypothetical protein
MPPNPVKSLRLPPRYLYSFYIVIFLIGSTYRLLKKDVFVRVMVGL